MFWPWVARDVSVWGQVGNVTWFFVLKTPEGNYANFVNAETGNLLFQIRLANEGATGTNSEQIFATPARIRWNGRELLAIQSISKCDFANSITGSQTEYRTDLWLVDKLSQLADHWTETASTKGSTALTNWFENSRLTKFNSTAPTVVGTLDNEELLGIATQVEGNIGIRLLACDRSIERKATVNRTVSLPIDPNSSNALVSIMDCDGDGISDFVSVSDAGIDCLSANGDSIWHRPPLSGVCSAFEPLEVDGRKYFFVSTNSPQSNSLYLDAGTGKECDAWKGHILSDDNSNDASLVVCDYDAPTYKVSAFQLIKPQVAIATKPGGRGEIDPRYVRLLPWAVHAKAFLWETRREVRPFTWPRILKLAIGVFLVPVLVLWSCARRQFSIRHLLLIATVIAVALALVVADKNAFPTDERLNGYVGALATACGAAVWIVIFTLPFAELSRTRWRRILSISLYGVFLILIPVFLLLAFPSGAIQTTYSYQEFWHLFWLALIPTGGVLLLIHTLRTMGGWFVFVAREYRNGS